MRDDWMPFESDRQRWVEEAEGFERLRRMWMWESKALRLDPDKQTPEELSKKRWKEFWAMFERSNWKTGRKVAEKNPSGMPLERATLPQDEFCGQTEVQVATSVSNQGLNPISDSDEEPF